MVLASNGKMAPERLLMMGCILGLMLIALVAGASHVLIRQQMAEQKSGAHVVNLSGRQRMLSQQLAKNAQKLLLVTNDQQLQRTFAALAQSLTTLIATHRGLIEGDPQQQLPGDNSDKVKQLFEEIEPYYQALTQAGNRLLVHRELSIGKLAQTAEVKDSVDQILANEAGFLSGMSRIVFQYANESEARLQRTSELEQLLFFTGLMILLLEAVFIFRPVILRTIDAMALLRKNERHLRETQQRLESSIAELREARENLLDVEKKAVLASVVAGVTHDVNTPIGVSVMAASTLAAQTRELQQQYEQGELRRSAMEAYQETALESTGLILSNLQRAAELIANFKQLAVDQSSEQRRRFNLKEYLEDVLLGLNAKLRTTRHQVKLHCPANIELDSYPGALYQVVSNLIMNSLIHAFADQEQGDIRIDVEQRGESLRILYRDNGCGMSDEVQAQLFDAFFTTRREQGGSGIGTHVIKTLVEETLGGSIAVRSAPGEGTEFQIDIPLVVADG